MKKGWHLTEETKQKMREQKLGSHRTEEGWEEFFTISLEYLTNGECFIPKG